MLLLIYRYKLYRVQVFVLLGIALVSVIVRGDIRLFSAVIAMEELVMLGFCNEQRRR